MVVTKMLPIIVLLIYNAFVVSAGNSSLTFVIDDSGSMEDDISQVRQGARGIMDIILNYKSSQIKDIVLVTFNDPVTLNKMQIKTRDPDELQAALNSIEAHNIGNSDWPEYSLSGIELALQNSQPNSYLFVFTDASAKDYDKVELIKSMCQKAQSQIFFILTDYCNYPSDYACVVYHDIATACSGQVFIVNKDDISKVLEYVKETVKGDKTIIKTIQIPRNIWTKVEFVIDDKTEYALISIAGQDVRIANQIGFIDYKIVVDTANTKAYRLNNPAPGKYGFHVMGSSQVSVMIFSRTDFVFDHGFSKMPPKSLLDTSKQPIAEEKSYLSISVTDPEHEVQINKAQILDMNEHVIHDLPLKRTTGDFYITQPFVSPNKLFQVAVIGTIITTGKTIRRLAKTPIEPQKPTIKPIEDKLPVTSINEGPNAQVPYNGTLQLSCTVTAYPAPNIVWMDDHNRILQSKSSPVELPYKYVSYVTLKNVRTDASYVCDASNKLSRHESTVKVVVTSPFIVEATPPATSGAHYGQSSVLQCKIKSSSRMRIDWSRKIKKDVVPIDTSDKYTISSDGTELKMNSVTLDSAGQYTCKAVLIDDPSHHKEFTTDVKITDLANVVLQMKNPNKTVKIKTPATLTCKIVKGNPKPTLTWQFKGKGSDRFVTLPNAGEDLNISSAALTDAGIYQCIATNIISEDKVRAELIVEAPPTIILDDGKSVYTAVEGDLVLRVPCNAVGYPEPAITWTKDGKAVQPDEKISIESGVLVIKNPVMADSTTYKCEAKNTFGTVSQEFEVEVTPYLFDDEDYGDSHIIHILRKETKGVKCAISHSEKDTIRWYKEGLSTNVTGMFYNIKDARDEDDGNYTCRVNSQMGSVSDSYQVIVGFPPSFKYDISEDIDWDGDDETLLDCSVNGKPSAKVEWRYNGKVIQQTKEQLSNIQWGIYECDVKNPHGAVNRRFKVFSTGCLINTTSDITTNTPLMLSEQSTWPELESTKNSIIVEHGAKLKLSCHDHSAKRNHFKHFPKEINILATCDKQFNFLVDGKSYGLSDLACDKEVQANIVKSGTKCFYENSEMIRVGFNVNRFVEAYHVCYDTEKNVPLYAYGEMSTTNGVSSPVAHSWFKYAGIGDGRSVQGNSCGEGSSCCYGKSQLINARDVSYGPAQKSTFIDHLNSIVLWHPCNSNSLPWLNLEEGVRRAFEDDRHLSVWSGASNYDIKDGAMVPRYLWKVIKYTEEDPIAVVYVNDPSPTKHDILCENLCASASPPGLDIDGLPSSYMYCCQLNDFIRAFKLPEYIFTTH